MEAAPDVDLDGVETYLGRPYRNFSHATAEAATYMADTFINTRKWVPEPIQYDHTLSPAPPPRT